MEFLSELLRSIPPLSLFAIMLALQLALPRLAERVGLPALVGFIAIGMLLGPNGIGLLHEKGPIIAFFANLGKLLLMFFAGFEVDLVQFARVRKRAMAFGALTFAFPFLTGAAVALVVGYPMISAVLIGSLLASHTLLGYPIVKRQGLLREDSVVVSIGATVFTDVAALLVLAICIPIHESGFSPSGFLELVAELAIFMVVVLVGISRLVRFLLHRYGKTPEGTLTVLLIAIAVAAELAEEIHLEGIVGAFLVGLAIKRAVRDMPIDHTLETIAQALFIPAFFITTGFLIDVFLFGDTVARHPGLAAGIVAALFAGKWLAARTAGWAFAYRPVEWNLMWSLSLPQVAATLAAAIVAFRTVNARGEPLIEQPVLNAILVLVVLTSILGPMLTERFGRAFATVAGATSGTRTTEERGAE